MEDQREVTDRSVEPSSRPRLSAFNYDSIRKDRQAEEPAADPEISDTEVESPAIEPPKQGLAEIVRSEQIIDDFWASDRGIRPVFVPSLRENATRLRLRADALQEQSPEHALQLWREYITLCPRDSDAWYAFGQSALMSGLDRQVHRAFSTTVELDPHHGLAEAALGFLVEKTGDYASAQMHYTRAVELRPNCLDMLGELVRVTSVMGQAEEAEALCEKFENLMNSRSRVRERENSGTRNSESKKALALEAFIGGQYTQARTCIESWMLSTVVMAKMKVVSRFCLIVSR